VKVVDSLAMRAALWPILALSIVPLLSMFLSSRERNPIDFSIMTTSLVWIDVFLKPPDAPIPYDLCSIARWARSFCGVSCWV